MLACAAPAIADDQQSAHEQRLAAQAKCAAHAPDCDWIATFSSLEKLSIARALDKLAFQIDPAPWGKTIGYILIYNEDVFAEPNWLQFFNIFHFTTAESKIRGELTIDEGEVWDEEKIAESARRLKDPLYTGVVAFLPIKSIEAGKVDMLVVTRDIWSLRLNTQYSVQGDALTNFTISLAENNFLGRRKTVALALLMDQGAIAFGPLFIDKNFLGLHLDFRFRIDKLFTRQRLDVVDPFTDERRETTDPTGLQDEGKIRDEGSQATVALTRTLWSLASEWGGGGSFSYRNAIARSYYGTGLRAVDDPSTPDNEFLPREYRLRTWSARASVLRQWGKVFKHQVEVGHLVTSQKPELLENFPDDPALQMYFEEAVFPRTELVSSPFIEYSIFRADYRTIRNVDTFDLAEDIRVGPNATIGVQQSLKFLGSDYYFTRPSIAAGWTMPFGRDAFLRLSAGAAIRIQNATCPLDGGIGDRPCKTIDNTASMQLRGATPTLAVLRLIGQISTETRWHDTQNTFYSVGSDSGLRGYGIQQFIGDRRFVAQLEARSSPFPIWVLRFGAVLFYEAGGAASSYSTMRVYQDIGVGLRMLIPQTSRDLFRFDFAFPMESAPGIRAWFPRFVAGFDSYF